MPIKLIGRTNNFSGKTLWEILGNLKDFGVGRLVIRNVFQRYPEPTFMKIVKVEPLAFEEPRKVRVWVERTHRGYKYPKLQEICSVSYKADFQLIPKDEEYKFVSTTETVKQEERVFPEYIDFPPLLKRLVLRDKTSRGETVDDIQLKLKINTNRDNRARIAESGEKPNVEISMGLGKPASPDLYNGLNL